MHISLEIDIYRIAGLSFILMEPRQVEYLHKVMTAVLRVEGRRFRNKTI